MRRRERGEVSEVARRRLELLQAELAGLRREPDGEPDREQQAGDHEEFWTREQPPLVGPAALGVPAPVREPGRHARGVRAGPGYRVPGWLAERVPAALRGRVGLSGQHGVVVLALVGVALVVAGWLAVRSGAHADAVPPPRLVTTGGSATAEASPAVPAATAASAAATGQVVVDVAGKVRRPGIVTLPAGSRVQDAIRRAGGPRPGVVLTSLNLARRLVAGEQVLVGRPVVPGVAPSAADGSPAAGALVNLNAATLSELDTLPGVGPVTAQKIIDWRTQHGTFTSVDELLEVDGIGDKTLADIAPHVTL